MKFNLEEVQNIAKLSRLSLSPEEEKDYAKQLASVLDYMKMLDELNLKDLDKSLMPESSELENVWRSDEVKEWLEDELALAFAQADLQDGYVKVKRVL